MVSPCPECLAGKHDNCGGDGWNVDTDTPATCPCWLAKHYATRRPEYRLDLEFSKPLSLNNARPMTRAAAMGAAARVKAVRAHVRDLAVALPVPRCERVTVVMHYQPRDNRRRDTDNLIAMLKPCVDGLRDAKVIADDDPRHYTMSEPEIHPALKPSQPGRIWLIIRDLTGGPGQTVLPI